MKRILITFLIPVLTLFMSSVAITASTNPKSKPSTAKHVFGVHGLACPFCAIGIKKVFKKIKGVQSVKVSLKYNEVTVHTNKGICFSKSKLKSTFAKTGFTYHGTVKQPKNCR